MYFQAVPVRSDFDEQLTRLRGDDEERDIRELAEEARGLGWEQALISLWVSGSHPAEQVVEDDDEDGAGVPRRDDYRYHARQWTRRFYFGAGNTRSA